MDLKNCLILDKKTSRRRAAGIGKFDRLKTRTLDDELLKLVVDFVGTIRLVELLFDWI